jgi:hypothetical protein
VGARRLEHDSLRLEKLIEDGVQEVGFHGVSKSELQFCRDCILQAFPLNGEVDISAVQHFCRLLTQGHPNVVMKPPRMKYTTKAKALSRIRIGILRSDTPTPTGALQPERLKGSVVFLFVEANSFPSWKLVDSRNRRVARTYVILHRDTYEAMHDLMSHHDERMPEWWAQEELKRNIDVARWRIVAHWKTPAQMNRMTQKFRPMDPPRSCYLPLFETRLSRSIRTNHQVHRLECSTPSVLSCWYQLRFDPGL